MLYLHVYYWSVYLRDLREKRRFPWIQMVYVDFNEFMEFTSEYALLTREDQFTVPLAVFFYAWFCSRYQQMIS